MMLKIGLTGGIGSGKSVVADIFRNLGAVVYEADKEAKQLMQTNPELKRKIAGLLGDEAYMNHVLNTKYIAGKVFNNEDLLKQLNSLVHPAVHEDFKKFISEHRLVPYVIEEAAIIYESGIKDFFDYIIVVDAPENIRIKRVMDRDKISREQVRSRMDKQMKAEEKKKLADFIIFNDNDHLLIPQVLELHNKFVSLPDKN